MKCIFSLNVLQISFTELNLRSVSDNSYIEFFVDPFRAKLIPSQNERIQLVCIYFKEQINKLH